MPKFKDGDRVQVKVREVQGKEALEGRYAPHLGGTRGTILKVYSPEEIAVDLDIDSLPESVRQRHAEQQSAMHEKWLNSLSEEARNRLTDEEKTFRLRYVVLLSEADLEPLKEPTRKAAATPGTPSKSAKPSPQASETAAKPAPRTSEKPAKAAAPEPQASSTKSRAKGAKQAEAIPTPPRPTPEQLDQLEERYLKSRRKR